MYTTLSSSFTVLLPPTSEPYETTVWREIFAGQNLCGLAAGKDFVKKFSWFDDCKATPILGAC